MLLQKETVTAPYLAEKFEVSRRTINRDIEDLCKAGIPIVTKQGVSGGVSIMENYKLDGLYVSCYKRKHQNRKPADTYWEQYFSDSGFHIFNENQMKMQGCPAKELLRLPY